MPEVAEQIVVESKKAETVENTTRSSEQDLLRQHGTDANLRRAQFEANKRFLKDKTYDSSEVLSRRNLEKSEYCLIKKDNLLQYHDVRKIEQRFQSNEQIAEYRQQAWQKLANSPEGKILIDQAGGKNNLLRIMADERHDFLTRSATMCEKAGLEDNATGRNVHRLAELFTLEKCPKDILNGVRQVEQRIDYHDQEGKNHHVELDDITHMRDGRAIIRDYKPVNLSHFERTSNGQAWAKWAEKMVGPNFREQIQAGASPFFTTSTDGSMPKSIQSALQGYLKEVAKHHRSQLEKYRDLYSEASGIDGKQIKTAIEPYFKFSSQPN